MIRKLIATLPRLRSTSRRVVPPPRTASEPALETEALVYEAWRCGFVRGYVEGATDTSRVFAGRS